MTHRCVMTFVNLHKLMGIYMEVLILGTILQYMVSASFKLFLMVGKGLMLEHASYSLYVSCVVRLSLQHIQLAHARPRENIWVQVSQTAMYSTVLRISGCLTVPFLRMRITIQIQISPGCLTRTPSTFVGESYGCSQPNNSVWQKFLNLFVSASEV